MDSLLVTGFAGGDAEMRYTPNGTAVTNFSVGVNRSYQKDDEWINRTMWVKITCWGKLAEAMNQKVKKGMFVVVTGHLEPDYETGGPRLWKDKNGVEHASYEMTAASVQCHFVDKSKEPVKKQGGEFYSEEEERF